MFSPKLLELLLSLSNMERNRLRKFLLSPYFNEQQDVIALFELTDAAIRKGEEAIHKLDKEFVWKKVYSKEKFDEQQLRRLASELIQLCLQYLGHEYIARRPLNEQVAIHLALLPTDLEKHIASVERRINTLMAQKEQKSLDDYYFNYKYTIGRLGYATKNTVPTDFLAYIEPLDQQLDIFYIAQKLQLFCRVVVFLQTRNAHYDPGLGISSILTLAEQPAMLQVPLVKTYRSALICLQHTEEVSYYRDFLEVLHAHETAITKEDLQDLYQHALNYCALRINAGDGTFLREMFGIYKQIVEKGLLVPFGILPENQYKNIISISLNLGEFEWTEQFIKEYSDFLPENIRENAVSYNLAYLYFFKKRFSEVVGILQGVEYSNLSYALGARWLLLRTYFELGEEQALDALFESFRIFVLRNKLMSTKLKKTYISLISITRRLANYPTPEKLAALKKKVLALDQQVPKGWVLEKIGDMERRR